MIQIISHTPLYVWPLLYLLLRGGWKARKTHVSSWRSLLTLPFVMFVWSAYATLTRYGNLSISLWAISIAVGIWLGTLTVRKLPLRFDRQRYLIEIAGNWTPMILSMSIFSLRYFLGMTYGLYPELAGNPALLAVENVAAVGSGMLIGRLIGYWQRSKAAPHTELVVLNKSF